MALYAVAFLMIFPLVPTVLVWVIRNRSFRSFITYVSSGFLIVATIAFAIVYLGAQSVYIPFDSETLSWVLFVVDIAMCLVVAVHSIWRRRWLTLVLAMIQGAISVAIEFYVTHLAQVEFGFYIDTLSVILALMIGVVGSLICIYAVGYMKDFGKHNPNDRRQPVFFSLMFMFLSAMFLIAFADNMAWFFAGWEVTTVCSFLLIGYTRTDEAIANAFRQINMNLLGGIAFGVAIILVGSIFNVLSLRELISLVSEGSYTSGVLMFSLALISVAALIKSAQMPFQSWLLGAMVAPTPTSALLHSSTMVKAGVFLLIKLSPCFGSTWPGIMVSLVGGVTFLMTALMAISQTNAKRVLAYSTISNLGLMALCAGIGTALGVWAAIFLMLFHAVVKAMLFMCVGTAEHHIGSRDIEKMDNLFNRMPLLAKVMSAGMMIMFVAPFGMLVAKWAAMMSIVESGNILLLIIVAFGSAPTFFFWAKWLGKVCAVGPSAKNVERRVHRCERVSICFCLCIATALCIVLPFASSEIVMPYLENMFALATTSSSDFYLVLASWLTVIIVVMDLFVFGSGSAKHDSVYLAGVGLDSDRRTFMGAMGQERVAVTANWRIAEWFSESVLDMPGRIICAVFMCVCVVVSALAGGVFPWI